MVGNLTGYTECRGMEGGLGNKSVGSWKAEKTGNSCGKTQEEDVPMETRWLSEGKLGPLRN